MKPERLKLLNFDILIEPVSTNDLNTEGVIHVVESKEKKAAGHFFKVVNVSERVKETKKGDIIILDSFDHTPPISLDGGRYAITSEDKIAAVIEQ